MRPQLIHTVLSIFRESKENIKTKLLNEVKVQEYRI